MSSSSYHFPKLAIVAKDTMSRFDEIICGKHGKELLKNIQNTKCYDTTLLPINIVDQKYDTFLECHKMDTVDCARSIQLRGYNPCVLNMSSEYKPGGGWKNGALAQEEVLFLRSNYALSLDTSFNVNEKNYYPIPSNVGIYSPGVFFFKDSKYELLDHKECFTLCCVAVPAIRSPKLVQGWMNLKDEEKTLTKMRMILRISLINGHDSVVLGAMGCGVFANPPEHIALLFNHVFDEPEFRGQFKLISFAIIDGLRTNNYEIFSKNITLSSDKPGDSLPDEE